MDITWDEFRDVASQLDELTQLRIEKAVLALRLQKVMAENRALHEQVQIQMQTVHRLEDDLRDTNGAPV